MITINRLVQLLEDRIFTRPLMSGGVYFNTTNEHVFSTDQTAYFEHPRASIIHQQLAELGILVRLSDESPTLHFRLPANDVDWQKLEKALTVIKL